MFQQQNLKTATAAKYSTKAGSKCLRLFEFTLFLIFSAYKILKNAKDFFHIVHVNFADIS